MSLMNLFNEVPKGTTAMKKIDSWYLKYFYQGILSMILCPSMEMEWHYTMEVHLYVIQTNANRGQL